MRKAEENVGFDSNLFFFFPSMGTFGRPIERERERESESGSNSNSVSITD